MTPKHPTTRPPGSSPDSPGWLETVAQSLHPHWGAHVLVAVSGGADSVALLRVLLALRERLALRLGVATFDHSTRAGQSREDAAFVVDLAARWDLPCDQGSWQADQSAGFEAQARRARYAWLVAQARQRGASVIVTGHHRDDQAETILHRVVRGTGLRGLAGIAPSRPLGSGLTLVRPLLAVGRADLRAYLAALDQPWREDSTNADATQTRNRLRLDLLPRLARDYNPAVAEALVRLGDLAADATTRLERRTARLLRRLTVATSPGQITFDRPRFRQLVVGDRVDLLRAAWRGLGWPEQRMSRARWHRLDTWAAGHEQGRFAVGPGIEALGASDRWTLRPVTEQVPALTTEVPLPVPGSASFLGGWVEARVATVGRNSPNPTTALRLVERVDADQIIGPCVVRLAHPSDRISPLGLGEQTQRLADLLRSRGLNQAARARVPVVADALGILWVVGHRIAHRVRRTNATCRVLELSWRPPAQESP